MFKVKFNNIQLFVENKTLINNINCSFKDLNCIHISGNNGIGKSSLFKSFVGFNTFHYNGELNVMNELETKLDRFIYLPQESIKFENITIGEYLATRNFESYNKNFLKCLRFTSIHTIDWYLPFIEINIKYLDLLNLNPKDSLFSLNYSKKRFIELLRLAIQSNNILLLDEPFEGMDENTLKYAISYLNESIDENMVFIIDHSENYKRLNLSIKDININDFN